MIITEQTQLDSAVKQWQSKMKWPDPPFWFTNRPHPLIDERMQIDFAVRFAYQELLFKTDEQFYKWNYDHRPHVCEECHAPLRNYSAVWCSHIISRGERNDMRMDCRNANLLCWLHHQQWESETKFIMQIYPRNAITITTLYGEYQRQSY